MVSIATVSTCSGNLRKTNSFIVKVIVVKNGVIRYMNEKDGIKTIESDSFQGKNVDILHMANCRILKPNEVTKLIRAIPKVIYVDMFEALLYSGCRYVEMQRLYKHPEWFRDKFIHLTKKSRATRKKKAVMDERYVHLNQAGISAIRHFLDGNKNLPTYKAWRENLVRWAEMAEISTELLSPKTTRKTWESWLVWYYPEKIATIFGSQGHTELTALRHYVNLPFTTDDKADMKRYVEGWE